MLLLAFLFSASFAGAQGPPGNYNWVENPSNGHWYALSAPGTWTDAENEALAVGGHLVTIRSQAEDNWLIQNFFQDFCPTSPGDIQGPWIGLSDEANEGTWVWSSGEPLLFSSWYPGEPNGNPGADFACYYSYLNAPAWADLSPGNSMYCGSSLPGIIEWTGAPTLVVSPLPLVRGSLATLEVFGVEKHDKVWFLYSLAGSGPFQHSLGFTLGLSQPIHNPSIVVAQSAGSVSFSTVVPSTAPAGLPIWLQALVQRSSTGSPFEVTNAVATQLQ